LLTDWAKDQSANEKGQKVIENDQLIELKSGDSELVSLAQALSKDYNFDVTRKHNVQFDKSALYVKTTQN